MKPKLTVLALGGMSVSEILSLIESGELSILETLGVGKMRKEMELVGSACGWMVNKVIRVANKRRRKDRNSYQKHYAYYYREERTLRSYAREYALEMLNSIAPVCTSGPKELYDEDNNTTRIVGFNHPTLGEIIRLIGIMFDQFPSSFELLFPVNLPWYEAIAPYRHSLEVLGIRIVPMITPSTERKIADIISDDKDAVNVMRTLKFNFTRHYIRACKAATSRDSIIMVAPSATRQATVFPSEAAYLGNESLNAAMSMILTSVGKTEKGVEVIPIAVLPPKTRSKKLNLFRLYTMDVLQAFDKDTMNAFIEDRELLRKFDDIFLRRIAQAVPKEMRYPPST